MATTIRLRWASDPSAYGPRRERASCSYDAYSPDPVAGRTFQISGQLAADVADAEAALIRLDNEATTLVSTEAVARLLLRAESVASSRIEGLEVGPRRLLRAEAALRLDDEPRDVTATAVLANIEAMAWAVEHAAGRRRITVDDIRTVHRRLLAGSRLDAHAGKLRTIQNWIGGNDFNPCAAQFVPPPPELVHDLLVDLCAFSSATDLPAVVQAAIAHAQFETIHPFVDGNGRTGRALIHIILRRRGLTTRVLAPVSLILATRARDYISGLGASRYRGKPDSPAARDGLERWIGTFAYACVHAAASATAFEHRITSIQEMWRERVRPVRKNSALDLLIRDLPGTPVLTVAGASRLVGRSFQAASGAIDRLAAAGILTPITVGRRNRAFESAEVIDALTDIERQMASPAADTRISPPKRRVPVRRRA